MIIKILLTIIFFAVMLGVGLYSRKQAASVDGFVLGGRSVGPWLLSLLAMLVSLDGNTVFHPRG